MFTCLQVGEQLKKVPGSDGINPYARAIEAVEGLDKIETLQDHPRYTLLLLRMRWVGRYAVAA